MPLSNAVRSITQARSRGTTRWVGPRLFAAFTLLLASMLAPLAMAQPENLLAGKKPLHSDGVKNAIRLTDGMLSNEGDEWLTDVTSRFSYARSFVRSEERRVGNECRSRGS